MQMGLDMAFSDPTTGSSVPWADPTDNLIAAIRRAPWKVVDVETTALNPTSAPQEFTAKELQRGVNPAPRLRILTVLFPTGRGQVQTEAFDFDRLTPKQRGLVADAALTGVFFGHNSGFDVYWCWEHSDVVPTMVLDSMLISRVVFPEQPLVLAAMCTDENEIPEFREAALDVFKRNKSGWALDHLTMTVLRRMMPKDLQGPKNWCQPFITLAGYKYATGDVKATYEILCKLLDVGKGEDLLERYKAARGYFPALSIIEPQVLDIVFMRKKGTPWVVAEAEKYVQGQWRKVSDLADQMVELEPELAKFRSVLVNADKGATRELKNAIGDAFRRRGLVLQTTPKSGDPMIGEKDLRKAKAATTEEAKPLFDVWAALCRAKKAGSMALEFSNFAIRSGDGRLHPNTGHGPATGRLSSSEPNCQQMPRDQGFRNAVAAAVGKLIVASDYSALDMRVAAALAIRAQRQIFEAYLGEREVPEDVLAEIKDVYDGLVTLEAADQRLKNAGQKMEEWRARKDEPETADARKQYWDHWRKLSRELLLARFSRCLKYVRIKAEAAGTAEWGMLRDAFSIPGMDIHTWTALGMIGQDPLQLFAGKSNEEVVAELKKAKKRLGDKRQTGKVGNLSLTYAMATKGLQDAAAKNYNIHWSFDEADKVRKDWLNTYVEVDLWHAWTELNPHKEVKVPDPDRGGELRRKVVFASYTLGERLVYAFGLQAALAYQDQSSGADILGDCEDTFHRKHPEVFECIVNQVHDEIVFEIPEEKSEEYLKIISDVMTASAEKFLMPYGVKGECSPAVGKVWLKD